MILLVHMIFGAALASLFHNPYLGFIISYLSHYFLDLFPHIEYLKDTESSIKNISSSSPVIHRLFDGAKVVSDFLLGSIIIIVLAPQPHIYLAGLCAIIPDGLTVVSILFAPRILSLHHRIHTIHIHYLTKQKSYHSLWRILSQGIALGIGILILIR